MIHSEPLHSYLRSSRFLEPMGLPGGQELSFSLLGQGEYHVNYVFSHPKTGKKLVLRLVMGSQMHLKDQTGYEFQALYFLAPSGRTPRPVFCDRDHSLLVMEWLPGEALDYKRDMAAAAKILADIHSTPVPENCGLLRPLRPAMAIYEECLSMVSHYLEWDRADRETAALLKELVKETGKLPLGEIPESGTVPVCMVNTELNSGNFLINPGKKSFLVDWEKPLLSEPAQDLGHFLAPTTTFWKTDVILRPEEMRAFVKAYVEAVDGRMDTAALASRLPLYLRATCLRGVTWCAMALREYLEPGRTLCNPDTLLKLKAYMEPEFLENILETYVRKDFLA